MHNNIKLWLCNDSLWSHDRRAASSKSSMAYRSYYYFLHRCRYRLSAPVWHGGVHRWRDSAERPRSPPPPPPLPPPLPGRVVEPCDIPYSTQYIYIHYATTTSISDYYIMQYTLLTDKPLYSVVPPLVYPQHNHTVDGF